MSLEFPGIISLQIQVTTKDFESWIHYWTIPLMSLTDILADSMGLVTSFASLGDFAQLKILFLKPMYSFCKELKRKKNQ